MDETDVAEQFERHLNSPKQTWLLGAGISFPANIPLMHPLTERVLTLAKGDRFPGDNQAQKIIEFVENDCPKTAHIEHYLTHLADLISISERSRNSSVKLNELSFNKEKIVEVHNSLLEIIAGVIRWGYRSNREGDESHSQQEELKGERGKSIVEITSHLDFVRAIFNTSRAGLDFVRSPVEFFTTNYDTLLEDALALSQIAYQDGFTGGGCAFWHSDNYLPTAKTRAIVTKLHGSIDWYRESATASSVLRVRDGERYPESGGTVMIWPQATKYTNTQRDPFANLFQRFRKRLSDGNDHVLLICGYSFGDEHINAEVETAMDSEESQLTLVAFSDEREKGLPPALEEWRSNKPWRDRLFIASPKGLYRGASQPLFGLEKDTRTWWTFDGVTTLFDKGLPQDIQETLQ